MHSFSLPAVNKLNNPELWELNISLAIRTFAGGLVDVFLPVYLYYNGLSLQTIFLFYVIVNLLNLLFSPIIALILSKIGPKHGFILNTPFQIIFYLLVYSFTVYNWNIFILTLFLSLAHSFFRQGLHIQIIQHTSKEHQGKSLGLIKALQIAAKALSPVLGAFLTLFFSFNLVLVLASILIFISNVPLLLTKDEHLQFDFEFFKIFKHAKWNEFWSLFAAGIELDMNQLIWPIILIVFLNNSFTTTGIITSISVIFSILASYFVGKYSDLKRNWLMLVGVISGSILWGLRSVVHVGWQIFMVDSGFGFSETLKNIPYDSKIYDRFRQQNIFHYMVFHQVAINSGRLALFATLFFIPNTLLSLWIGAASGWLHLIF